MAKEESIFSRIPPFATPGELTPGVKVVAPSQLNRLVVESRSKAVVTLLIGAVGLLITLGGPLVLFLLGGIGEPELIVKTFQSGALLVAAILGILLGVVALLFACFIFRRLDTKVAREEAIIGGVLGIESALIATALLYFVNRGALVIFARNFLNFSQIKQLIPYFFSGALMTLELGLASMVIGVVLGLFVSVFLVSSQAVIRAPARVYVNVFRGTPFLVQLSVIYFGLAIGLGIRLSPQVALVVTISLEAGAYMAEVFRAGIQSVPRGQLDAARGLGLTYLNSLRYVVIPQASRTVVPPLMNDFITLIKDTSFLVFLGVSLSNRDLYSVASQGYNQFYNSTFFIAAGMGYLAITLPLIWLVNIAERRMRVGQVSAAR
jgi:His/Glu/Gln/Arg/opine family amino acid ABC transporter permease subunit